MVFLFPFLSSFFCLLFLFPFLFFPFFPGLFFLILTRCLNLTTSFLKYKFSTYRSTKSYSQLGLKIRNICYLSFTKPKTSFWSWWLFSWNLLSCCHCMNTLLATFLGNSIFQWQWICHLLNKTGDLLSFGARKL